MSELVELNHAPLRIIYLEAENVKRLKAVRIHPDRTLVRIEGRNAQGKTSVLDAIAAALGGGRWCPEKPVREGERKAAVRLDLGDIQVERRWTAAGGTTLEVTSSDGAKLATPQAILDRMLGDLTFDPLAFVRMKPRDQEDILKRLAGLDFSAIEAERAQLFDERRIVARDAKVAEARVGPMPNRPEGEIIDLGALTAQHAAGLEHNRQCDARQVRAERAAEQASGARARVAELDRQLAEAQAAAVALANSAAEAAKAAEDVKRMPLADLSLQVRQATAHNAAIEARWEWERRNQEAKDRAAAAEALTKRIDALDTERERRLDAARFPLDGLAIGPTGVMLHNIPFSQASSAEQLRVAVAIGLASKPRARIMLCRDGSLLDNDNMLALHRIAEEFDAQVFVERVADAASPPAVFIEDGEVVT